MDSEINKEETPKDPSALNLDVSVLAEKTIQTPAIMDKYKLRVFDLEIQEKIEGYEKTEQQKAEFYKEEVFGSAVVFREEELEYIRANVFTSTISVNRSTAIKQNIHHSIPDVAILLIMVILMTVSGFGYGHHKKKEREKKLADLNNCYDE